MTTPEQPCNAPNMNTAAEKKLHDKLKRQRLGKLLSALAGVSYGAVIVQWDNGGILYRNLDHDCVGILNDELDDPAYVGKVKYLFNDQMFTGLEYL